MKDTASLIKFPHNRTIGKLTNNVLIEWTFSALEPHPKASQKRLLVQAGMAGIIPADDVKIMIDSLSLTEV